MTEICAYNASLAALIRKISQVANKIINPIKGKGSIGLRDFKDIKGSLLKKLRTVKIKNIEQRTKKSLFETVFI